MQTIIEVTARSVYGSVLLYPANEQATRLAALTGTKTLTMTTLRLAQSMGFSVVVTSDADTKLAARVTAELAS
jgi:hypothetical protein